MVMNENDQLATFLAAHRDEVKESNCQQACARWVCLLRAAGFTVEWIGGFANDDTGHAWLEVDGALFDPTADQYGGSDIEYSETERFDEDELDADGWPS
jgi:hypothetical protein